MSIITQCPPELQKLTENDFAFAANELQTEVACVKSVCEVEAAGDGFQADGRPKMLFEAHIFGYFTGYKYNAQYPQLSTTTWELAKPYYAMDQYQRFELAYQLDQEAACKSSSWGFFQIIGFNAVNYKLFNTAQEYVVAMCTGAKSQLMSFIKFCEATGLDAKLRAKDWAGFAYGYNGCLFAQNSYDVKLAVAYAKFSGVLMPGSTGDTIIVLQKALGLQACDGMYGPITQQAVKDFQSKNNLQVTGNADLATLAALNISHFG